MTATYPCTVKTMVQMQYYSQWSFGTVLGKKRFVKNAKKNRPRLIRPDSQQSRYPIPILLLVYHICWIFVNRYFPDILPKTVLDHYGHTERPTGDFDKNVKYSTRSRNNDRDILTNLLKIGEKVGNSTFKIYLISRRMIDFTAGMKRNKDLYRL